MALTAVPPTQMVLPQQTAQYTVTLSNAGTVTDTFTLTIDANWDTRLLLPTRTPQADLGLTLGPGETKAEFLERARTALLNLAPPAH